MVPPRPVKIPTSRRSRRNAVTAGAGGALDAGEAEGAEAGAADCARATRPAETNNDELTKKSRRFIPRAKGPAPALAISAV
jgi:hypothetical protein